MNEKISSLFKSRRFWAGLVAAMLPVIVAQLKLPLTEEQIADIQKVIMAWIVGDSISKTGSPTLAASFFQQGQKQQ